MIITGTTAVTITTSTNHSWGTSYKRPNIITRTAAMSIAATALVDSCAAIPIGGHFQFPVACVIAGTAPMPVATPTSYDEKVRIAIDDYCSILNNSHHGFTILLYI
jgi:hypothetical protein